MNQARRALHLTAYSFTVAPSNAINNAFAWLLSGEGEGAMIGDEIEMSATRTRKTFKCNSDNDSDSRHS
jgi:hypothetical protein